MARKIYSATERIEERRLRPEVALALILITFFFGGLAFVLFDISQNPERIDESNNNAILGEYVSQIEEFKTVETDNYSMRIPADWVNVNRPEIIVNGQRYYPDRYQGVTGENVGRWIDVYEGAELPNLAADKALKISANGAFLSVGAISPQCVSFTDLVVEDQNEPTQTTWEGVDFLCSMTRSANNLVAVETETTRGVDLVGDKTQGKYLFFFADRGSSQDNTIFQEILNSFRIK